MKIIHSEDICAPPQLVWDILINFEDWHLWNKNIKSLKKINQDTYQIWQKGLPSLNWKIDKVEPLVCFSWMTPQHRLLNFYASHEILPKGLVTQLTLTLEVGGFLEKISPRLIRKSSYDALVIEMSGLKMFCEEKFAAERC